MFAESDIAYLGGTENEYGAMVRQTPDGPLLRFDYSNPHLLPLLRDSGRALNNFTRNGARLYMDAGGHPEYATAEFRSPAGIAADEINGDREMREAMEVLAADRGLAAIILTRQVADFAGNSWGYHENLCVPRSIYRSHRLLNPLLIHTATRNIYCGAGRMTAEGKFLLSQKAEALAADVSASSGKKPLIMQRDEPHADADKFARTQIVGSEPNMSPWATRIKIGTTMLVREMALRGYDLSNLYARPGEAYLIAKRVAGDLTLRQTVQLASGAEMTPLNIQRSLWETATAMKDQHGSNDEERWMLEQWGRALDDLADDPQRLCDRADWPMLWRLLHTHMDNKGVGPDHSSTLSKSVQWSLNHPNATGMKLRDTLWKQWLPQSVAAPPADTRAAIRARFVNFVLDKTDISGWYAGWADVEMPSIGKMEMLDPYNPRNEQIDSFLDRQGYVA